MRRLSAMWPGDHRGERGLIQARAFALHVDTKRNPGSARPRTRAATGFRALQMLLPQSDELRPAERNYPIFHDGKMVTARSPNPLPNTPGVRTEAGKRARCCVPVREPRPPKPLNQMKQKVTGKGCALRVC